MTDILHPSNDFKPPKGSSEISNYFKDQAVLISVLGECDDLIKGSANIIQTYVMANAERISDEHRILEALYIESNAKQITSNTDFKILPSNEFNIVHLKQKRNQHIPQFIEQKNFPRRKCNGFYENASSNKRNCSDIINQKVPSSSPRFILPHFDINLPKELFLTEIFKITVAYSSRIIILFDAPDDWCEIAEKKELDQKDIVIADTSYGNYDRDDNSDNSDNNVFEADITMAVESEETDENNDTVVTWLRLALDDDKNKKDCSKNENYDKNNDNENCNSNTGQNNENLNCDVSTSQNSQEDNSNSDNYSTSSCKTTRFDETNIRTRGKTDIDNDTITTCVVDGISDPAITIRDVYTNKSAASTTDYTDSTGDKSYITSVENITPNDRLSDRFNDKMNKLNPNINIITDTQIADTNKRMGDEAVYGYRVALLRFRIYTC